MIKVTALFPYEEGKKFDHEYWLTSHIPMIEELLSPMGLVKTEKDKGLSGTDPNAPAPYVALTHLFFSTADEVHTAFTAHAGAIMGDISNYTDIKPTFQISEIVD